METRTGSRPLAMHLLRGLIGGLLFAAAYAAGPAHAPLAVLLGLGGLAVLRGCPLCWVLGLVEKLTDGKKH